MHYEANKKLWIACQTESSNFASILMKALQRAMTLMNDNQSLPDDTGDVANILSTICRIITTLCTFDGFSVNVSDDALNVMPIVQSGHSAVQALYQAGAVRNIHQIITSSKCNHHHQHHHHHHHHNDSVERLDYCSIDESIGTAFSALRAMAIQDDVVQCMDKIGVVDTAVQALHDVVRTGFACKDRKKEHSQLVTAILGLLRNVSANDDIKTTLCLGINRNIVQTTIQAMEMYHDVVLLQEHGCGLFAAMALRKPKNATTLVMAGVHVCIVNVAMRPHPTFVTLQRQGALAIRNIVSRSPELRNMILNDCDTEVTLRTIAGTHLRCQDEVYAALRDLGLEVRSIHVHNADDGTVTVQEGRSAFGARNPNFRPEYTPSDVTTTMQ
jgi:hypothetical protein